MQWVVAELMDASNGMGPLDLSRHVPAGTTDTLVMMTYLSGQVPGGTLQACSGVFREASGESAGMPVFVAY